ncbi:ABC transporter permease [Aquibacillus koreensis]|uniref:Transport permease protein n=1 Tax=Aquibacillus koreensis TaxID=279446 RepID=A0A9X3WHD4_9BACI|nr:ABC transporter permease [Aquibacillus koreensis]MCT2535291.1 ABC transporter permease [Aquibacillus koreensis]MDC3419777.1 ABC transporter permease [Aquibacillus koreensis]
MKSAISVINEQVKHLYLARRLSLYELKSSNNNNYLGMAWEIFNPLIQIAIYWFVFGYGIRRREDIEVYTGEFIPFLPWMLSGIIVWFFFYQSTIQGSKSIYSRLRILSKMNFPMSVIPNIVIFSQFYIHLIMIVITIITLQFFGYAINIYYIQIIYFIFATFAFTYSLALITSTLSTLIRDVHMFLNATLRMLLYLSPILWSMKDLDYWIQFIMRINPLYYIIEGYRASFLGLGWYFVDSWQYTLYFWGLTIVFFLIGSSIHVKFRRHFIDFL